MAVQDSNFATANDQDLSDGLPGTIFRKCFGIQSLDSLLMSVFQFEVCSFFFISLFKWRWAQLSVYTCSRLQPPKYCLDCPLVGHLRPTNGPFPKKDITSWLRSIFVCSLMMANMPIYCLLILRILILQTALEISSSNNGVGRLPLTNSKARNDTFIKRKLMPSSKFNVSF